MGHKFRSILTFIIFIAIIFAPVPSSRGPLPVKNDPRLKIAKRISKMIQQSPKFAGLTNPNIQVDEPETAQEKQDSAETVITGDLREAIRRYREQGEKNIRIVLDAKDVDELSDIVKDFGGMVLRKGAGFLAIEIPVDSVEQLIRENSSIGYARLPFRFFPTERISEGVALTGAGRFHDTIYRGAGVKIAIIDVGFMGLTQAISNGELPGNVITEDFSDLGLETEYYHGTACAEIVHDMAPDAELHLLKLGDEIDGYEVIDYCIKNNIDIVSMSISTFGSGPGDGTGPVDAAFDRLREAGILLAASAGNCGTVSYTYEDEGVTITLGSHWEGAFNDNNSNQYHEFKEWDAYSEYNVIWAYPDKKDDGVSLTDEVSILLRWDDWPYSAIDYDMELYTFDYENQRIGTKLSIPQTQHNGNQPPIEYISLDVPDTTSAIENGVFYALKVKRKDTATPTGKKLEVYLGGTSSFVPFRQLNGTVNSSAIATSKSSMMEPADAESVMAVGAIDYMNWENGPQEEFSSQGPTNNWNGSSARIKPDVMGPDGVTTYSYGYSSFFGTSAATPHAAGLAALILSMNPDLSPDALQAIIEENAINMGTWGSDNLYGWGKINVTLPGFPIVMSHQKISDTEGNFAGMLGYYSNFGNAVASIGDLDEDGIEDIAVGAYRDNSNMGAVWILFMNSNGTVKTHQKISNAEGNFTGTLDYGDNFGSAVASIGDLDEDGIEDIAVGAYGDNSNMGAVCILFMKSDGTVKAHKKISSTEGNFTGMLDYGDFFGSSIASIGDLNGDGVKDLAVGADQDDDGGYYRGAVWVLFMNSNGTVKTHQKISNTEGNFTGTLDYGDFFGSSVASIGDFNGDGIKDLAVGAYSDDDGDSDKGAVWVLLLNSNGTVKSHVKISDIEGGFTGTLNDYDNFGSSIASTGDLYEDGSLYIAVGAPGDDGEGGDNGAVWILRLDPLAIKFDMEHDGIPDVWERRYDLNADINDAAYDPDGDGLPNIIEYRVGTNPKNSDTDNDGIMDGDEDANHNGVVDSGETDPTNMDTDNDGMPDGWEVQYGFKPLVNDANDDLDKDGYSNLQEYLSGTDPKNNMNHPNPPVAQAGDDQIVDEGATVMLDGSNSSDPDDGIASYQWTQLDGSSVTLSDCSAVSLDFTSPGVGPDGDWLIFQLTVTDKGGLQSTDICIVNVEWVRIPPVALEQTLETNEDHPLEITLQADHDPDLKTITYTIGDQVNHGVLTGNAPDLLYTPNADYFGSDSFTFRINDTYSDSDAAEIKINVISTVGDLDDNGIIDLKDAVLAIQACTNIDSDVEIYIKEEVNGDGRIGMEDVLYILRKISGSK